MCKESTRKANISGLRSFLEKGATVPLLKSGRLFEKTLEMVALLKDKTHLSSETQQLLGGSLQTARLPRSWGGSARSGTAGLEGRWAGAAEIPEGYPRGDRCFRWSWSEAWWLVVPVAAENTSSFSPHPVFRLVESITLRVSARAWRNTPALPCLSLCPLPPGGRSQRRCSAGFLCGTCIDVISVKSPGTGERARRWDLAPCLSLPERLLPAVGSGGSRGPANKRRLFLRVVQRIPNKRFTFSFLSSSRSPFFSPALRWRFKQFFFWFKLVCAATRNQQ